MTTLKNSFITSAYVSPKYFCDREQESKQLVREFTEGKNVALISSRKMGKTGLIQLCFQYRKFKQDYMFITC